MNENEELVCWMGDPDIDKPMMITSLAEKPECKYQRFVPPGRWGCALDHSYCEFVPRNTCHEFKPLSLYKVVVTPHGHLYEVTVDGISLGCNTEWECNEFAEALRESDEKCELMLKMNDPNYGGLSLANSKDDRVKIEMADDILNKFGVDLEEYMYLIQCGDIDLELHDYRQIEKPVIRCMKLSESQRDWMNGSTMTFQDLMSALLNVEMRRVKERGDDMKSTSWRTALWKSKIYRNFVTIRIHGT